MELIPSLAQGPTVCHLTIPETVFLTLGNKTPNMTVFPQIACGLSQHFG
jgi:hypothetical protein